MQYRPLSLPRVPRAQQLTANLIPDPVTPSAHALVATTSAHPSLLRRSRQVLDGAHFSFVTPLTIPFPYDIPSEGSEGDSSNIKPQNIESFLGRFEASAPTSGGACAPLPAGRQEATYPSARLVAFSPEAHRDCLPHLDVGDTVSWIQRQQGKEAYSSGPRVETDDTAHLYGEDQPDAAAARRAFSDWASGRALRIELESDVRDDQGTGVTFLSREEDRAANTKRALAALYQTASYGPWSLRYGGHQFGEWAGQLGDGRAVSLVETLHPDTHARCEVQLKGAGRTPYSRFADGLATLKSSTREFLASEYMAALGIPTSRALCVVSLPDVPVHRETLTTAGITMRLATSWLRIGNFELHASRHEWESSRVLGEYVSKELLGHADVVKGPGPGARPPWVRRLLYDVARRNVVTFAKWQAYGFMHGVLNTDNISLLGETIDYGPYGFMDAMSEDQVCNHSDWMHRYSYEKQPTMLCYAMDRLFDALAPLLGFEIQSESAPAPGDLSDVSRESVQDLARVAESERSDLQAYTRDELQAAWLAAWCRRLGVSVQPSAESELIEPWLDAIEGLDFTHALRTLCEWDDTQSPASWADRILARAHIAGSPIAESHSRSRLTAWFETYASWRRHDRRSAAEVQAEMRRVNPRFVLRNWITDKVGESLERHDTAFVERVRAMCARPFDAWDTPEDEALCEVRELLETRLPSCSS